MRQRVRNFWAGTNPAQKFSLTVGTIVLVAVLQLGTVRAPAAPFTCTNPGLGHTVAIAGEDTDTPRELARKYCKGNLIAAADALAAETRYTTDTIFHGAIVHLPNSK